MKLFFVVIFSALFFTGAALAEDGWNELKGDHFIVYYRVNQELAKNTLRQAEIYYNHIASDLGYARFSNFWQWDARAKIYIYPTKDEYTKVTGQPGWTEGIAVYDKKTIVTYEWHTDFIEALLPHEITHLIFRDFVGFTGDIPIWLDEGVAQWEEPKKRALSKLYAREVIRKQQMFPLLQLTAMRDLSKKDEESVTAFYIEAASLVDFLVGTYGSLSFSDFCRNLRDGKSMGEALSNTYSGRIKDLDDLEQKWIAYVKKD